MVLMPDTGSSIEGISDVHLHKADSSSSTFLLRPLSLSPPLSIPFPCLLLATLPTSASFYIRYLKALPLSVLSSALLSRLSTRTRCFAFIRPFAPLHCTFQPCPLSHLCPPLPHTAYLPFVFLRGTRISLLNLVLQVTILLLSPVFSMIFFLPLFNTFIVSR